MFNDLSAKATARGLVRRSPVRFLALAPAIHDRVAQRARLFSPRLVLYRLAAAGARVPPGEHRAYPRDKPAPRAFARGVGDGSVVRAQHHGVRTVLDLGDQGVYVRGYHFVMPWTQIRPTQATTRTTPAGERKPVWRNR